MPLCNLDLDGTKAIDQGYEWALTLLFPGNVAQSTVKGQIRTAPGGTLLTSFRTDPLTYDTGSGFTKIRVYLTATQTKNLQVTSSALWVYDLAITSLGKPPQLLLRGHVQVNPRITA
jgi:hypothetical protein